MYNPKTIKMNIIENNKLIAEFIGGTISDDGRRVDLPTSDNENRILNINGSPITFENGLRTINYVEELRYHNSWDWLMTVVDKIESFTDDNNCCKYNVKIEQCWVEIIDNQNSDEIVSVDGDDKILSTYKAVVEFIKNYN